MNTINSDYLFKMYRMGYFPMAESKKSSKISFFKPYKRFLIPIFDFHVPRKLFKEFKKKNIFSK